MFVSVALRPHRDISLRPHDHKLRKYLSVKSFSIYREFYLTNCFNDLKIWTISAFKPNIIFFPLIIETTSNVIRVWNFGLRIFSVYGRGPDGDVTITSEGMHIVVMQYWGQDSRSSALSINLIFFPLNLSRYNSRRNWTCGRPWNGSKWPWFVE